MPIHYQTDICLSNMGFEISGLNQRFPRDPTQFPLATAFIVEGLTVELPAVIVVGELGELVGSIHKSSLLPATG
jgi:hypothetical protein